MTYQSYRNYKRLNNKKVAITNHLRIKRIKSIKLKTKKTNRNNHKIQMIIKKKIR